MTTQSLIALPHASKLTKYNKKREILNFLKKFKIQFDMKEDAIDLRTMAENYPNKIIPLEDIQQAIRIVLGPKYGSTTFNYDPSGGATIIYPNETISPRFAYIDWCDGYLWTLFQRDVAPNHTEKIYIDFDPTCIIVPCAIKITIDGKVIYCIWDGHHTLQVCRLKGYNKFPVWYIDVDHIPLKDIEQAGFGSTPEERIKYGVWLAGSNMIRINSKNKRKLSPYDEFMIKLETRDADTIAMNNILVKNNCVPKRHATMSGAFTQIKSGEECYDLSDTYGNKGQFWDRALAFHRRVWPKAPLELEVFRPLSMFYHRAATQGFKIDTEFDLELENLLVSKYGDPTSVQEGLKDSYWDAYYNNIGNGTPVDHDKSRVLCGLINLYNQKIGRINLPPAEYVWKVK